MSIRFLFSLVLGLAPIAGCVDPGSVRVGDPPSPAAGGETAQDGACAAAGAPLALRTITLPVAQFGAGDARRAGAAVEIFADDAILRGDACAAPDCARVRSDESGMVSASLRVGSRFAYRVLPDDDGAFVRTLGVGVPLGPENEAIRAMPRALLDAMFAHAAIEPDVSRGHLAGAVRDCRGLPVQGATLRVIDPAGREITDARALFSDPDAPAQLIAAGVATTASGRFALVNVAPAQTLRVEAWAPGAGGPRRIACLDAPIEPDALTILPLHAASCEGVR